MRTDFAVYLPPSLLLISKDMVELRLHTCSSESFYFIAMFVLRWWREFTNGR